MYESTDCVNCGAVLIEGRNGVRQPCPKCGGIPRKYVEEFKEEIRIYEHLRMKGKHEGRGKAFFDQRVGASFYFKDQEWHHLERLTDRDNDLYIEKIINMETGEVIRQVTELLSVHQGHGSAKHKK